jgi:hypothetical protein
VNLSDQRSWTGLASPSNLAMAALVGFLFVGQATDWKVISRGQPKATVTTRFGIPAVPTTSGSVPLLRGGTAQRTARPENTEQVVDRGNGASNQTRIEREID